jgi:hypothetical protein
VIDFQPKSTTEHAAAWPAVVARIWDFSDFAGELPEDADRPGLHREHVLDFHDGMRLIVSVDKYGDGATYMHVSGSVRPNTRLREAIVKRKLLIDQFIEKMQERVKLLCGKTVVLGYITQPKGIPHLFDPPLNVAVAALP